MQKKKSCSIYFTILQAHSITYPIALMDFLDFKSLNVSEAK